MNYIICMIHTDYVICMTHMDHIICMKYTDYVICKNKKHLRVFLEFCFNVGCTSNIPGAPSKDRLVSDSAQPTSVSSSLLFVSV